MHKVVQYGACPAHLVAMLKYCESLRADVVTETNTAPKARVHRVEWQKVMNGDPVEINPSVGGGYKVMTVEEWSARWKRNEDFPACLACGSTNTKEHHFQQTWCRGCRKWESETLCLDCFKYSWRSYSDPDFATPEEHEKRQWEQLVASQH